MFTPRGKHHISVLIAYGPAFVLIYSTYVAHLVYSSTFSNEQKTQILHFLPSPPARHTINPLYRPYGLARDAGALVFLPMHTNLR